MDAIENWDEDVFTEKTFWDYFLNDIERAEKIIQIVSPYLTVHRSSKLYHYFKAVAERGVKIIVHTRYPAEHQNENSRLSASISINALKYIGVQIKFKAGIHQKIAIIDNKIIWSGSLNILSWRNTFEQMTRTNCQNMASKYKRLMKLDS